MFLRTRILFLPLVLASGVLNLAGCGQAGPLYLVRPARPAPASSSTPAAVTDSVNELPASSQATP